MLRWEQQHGKDVEAELRRLYQQEGLTQQKVAAEMRVSFGTVNRWMERLGIPARRPIWVAAPLAAVS